MTDQAPEQIWAYTWTGFTNSGQWSAFDTPQDTNSVKYIRADLAQETEKLRNFDNEAVDRFAAAMKAKLARKRAEGRSGWQGPDCTCEMLSRMLREHVVKGDPVDVGNLSMMLHQRGEKISGESQRQIHKPQHTIRALAQKEGK